jgi:hypothetical protein
MIQELAPFSYCKLLRCGSDTLCQDRSSENATARHDVTITTYPPRLGYRDSRADVQEKLTAISVEGETQSSAALVTAGQLADDQQGGRRSAEELAYHMREGLRSVREIARRALEMGVLAVATVGSVLSVS